MVKEMVARLSIVGHFLKEFSKRFDDLMGILTHVRLELKQELELMEPVGCLSCIQVKKVPHNISHLPILYVASWPVLKSPPPPFLHERDFFAIGKEASRIEDMKIFS